MILPEVEHPHDLFSVPARNPLGAVFCDECGIRLEAACAACREPNRLEAKFCRKCGQSLVHIERDSQSGVARFTSPASYTPTHLAEKILRALHARIVDAI